MQPSSDQFRPHIYSTQPERGSADVVDLIDAANQIDASRTFNTEAESKEDKIARATMNALDVLERQAAIVAAPETQQSIEPYMKRLGDMGLVLENFREQRVRE